MDFLIWLAIGLALLNLGVYVLFTAPAREESPSARAARLVEEYKASKPSPSRGGKEEEGGEEPPTAVLEVGKEGSWLLLEGRRIPLKAQDYRVLGEAGLYLTPGYRLQVRGQVDESFVVAAGVLAALGVAVLFEEAA